MIRTFALGIALLASSIANAQSFQFSLSSPTATFDPIDGTGSATVEFSITELPSAAFPSVTQAFSLGVVHQTSTLDLIAAVEAGPLPALRGGLGPEFFGVSFYSNGFTVGCVYTFDSSEELTFTAATPVVSIQYDGDVNALQGTLTDVTGTVSFVQTLGDPDVENAVLSDFVQYTPTFVPGLVTFTPMLAQFVRGDVNGDGDLNLVDVARLLAVLFQGGVEPCEDAVDIDDNGSLEVTDAIALLNYLFLGGGAPAAPFPSCGEDPTPLDGVTCDSFSGCP